MVQAGAAVCAKAARVSGAAFLSLSLADSSMATPNTSPVLRQQHLSSPCTPKSLCLRSADVCPHSRFCLPFPHLAHRGGVGAVGTTTETHWHRIWQQSECAPQALAPDHVPFVVPQPHFLLPGEAWAAFEGSACSALRQSARLLSLAGESQTPQCSQRSLSCCHSVSVLFSLFSLPLSLSCSPCSVCPEQPVWRPWGTGTHLNVAL